MLHSISIVAFLLQVDLTIAGFPKQSDVVRHDHRASVLNVELLSNGAISKHPTAAMSRSVLLQRRAHRRGNDDGNVNGAGNAGMNVTGDIHEVHGHLKLVVPDKNSVTGSAGGLDTLTDIVKTVAEVGLSDVHLDFEDPDPLTLLDKIKSWDRPADNTVAGESVDATFTISVPHGKTDAGIATAINSFSRNNLTETIIAKLTAHDIPTNGLTVAEFTAEAHDVHVPVNTDVSQPQSGAGSNFIGMVAAVFSATNLAFQL